MYINIVSILKAYRVEFDTLEDKLGYTRETWLVGSKQDRHNGPAVIVRDPKGQVVLREWYQDGLLDRADGPARIEEHSDIYHEVWCRKGYEHREGAPSSKKVHIPTGLVLEEHWSVRGVEHRDDGPAYVNRDLNSGTLVSAFWSRNGRFHRTDGPAVITRDPTTGVQTSASWMQNGQHYREDGPSTINRDPNTGEILHQNSPTNLSISTDTPDIA